MVVSKEVLKGDDYHRHIHRVNELCKIVLDNVAKIQVETERYIMKRLEEEQDARPKQV